MRPRRDLRFVSRAGVVAVALAALVACGDDSDSDNGGDDPPAAVEGAGVPEECTEAIPMAFGEVDLADVSLLPADWPEPPVEATLCLTTSTGDDNMETAEYITDASEEEVLTGYAEMLSDYAAVRAEDGLGDPVVTGTIGTDAYFEIQSDPGVFRIVLQRQ